MGPQTNWRRWAGIMTAAAIAVGLLVALSVRRTIRSAIEQEARPERATLPSPRPPQNGSPPGVPPTPAYDLGLRRTPEPTPPVAEAAASVPDRPVPTRPPRPVPEDEDHAAVRQAILDATPEALVRGKPIKWRAGGLSGYVVPSETQDYGDRTCRNIYATTIDGREQEQGRAQRWCRPIDGDGWAPE